MYSAISEMHIETFLMCCDYEDAQCIYWNTQHCHSTIIEMPSVIN